MTPAEELLAAVKEHATAEVEFEFIPRGPKICVLAEVCVDVFVRDGKWCEDVYGTGPNRGIHEHDSASSAVYSAFLRARK